jgi:putative ABC transport system permease protein
MSVRRFFRRSYWDDERAREIAAHIAHEIDDHVARGMTPDDARAAAYRKFGNPTSVREEIYTMNTLGFLESIWQDVRYGVRLLRRNPTFAAVAILTLALGTGANTAMFEVANAVWLRPLPIPHPEQLVQVQLDPHKGGRSGDRTGRYSVLSVPEWQQLRDRQRVFSSIAAWGTASFNIAHGGPMQLTDGVWVSGTFFDTIGVPAYRGRTLGPADDSSGCGTPPIVLSYAFWQRHFGGSSGAIGQTLPVDGHALEIIGVMPPGFTGIEVGRSFDIAAPLCAEPLLDGSPDPATRATYWFFTAVGRLAPGVSLEQADAQLAALSPSMYRATVPAAYDAQNRREYLALTLGAASAATGLSTLRSDYGEPVRLLLGLTVLVLLIACANVANLMLARAATRTREVSIRLAIGASRGRVVRQLVSESLVIALLGSAAGLLIARWATTGLVALMNRTVTGLWLDVAADARVFTFAAGVAVIACVIFGVTPALRGTAVNPAAAMKAGGRGTVDSSTRVGLRSALVVVQVALSVVLVIGALLFARTLRNLGGQDLGFDPRNVLVGALDLSEAHVPAAPQSMFHQRLLGRIRALPGVDSAAEISVLPLDGSTWNERIAVNGREAPKLPMFNSVTPGFFAVMRTPLVAGRDFVPEDATGRRIVIVTEAFARTYFNGSNPLERTFEVIDSLGSARVPYTIVGVVRDSKYSNLRQSVPPIAYVDMDQIPADDSSPHLLVRSTRPIAAVSDSIARAIAQMDPLIAVRYRTMDAVVETALSRERLMATLSGVFGGLAVLIAMVGLYGVMSYVVARRRIEIGVRMALGAEGGAVQRMVIAQAGWLVVAGLVIGAGLAVVGGRAAAALLFGVRPADPVSLAIALTSLSAVALAASWLPAHRAARLDPTSALRDE